MADDFGFQPSAPSDDLGFQPAPKMPDTSGVQKMAQDNLSKPTEGDSEQPTQTHAQRLDTAAGIPVSTALKGGDIPLTPAWRGHVVDAYKNGTATNVGDFMQTALHSIVPLVASGTQRSLHPVDFANQILDAGTSMVKGGAGQIMYPFVSDASKEELRKGYELTDYKNPDAPTDVEKTNRALELWQGTVSRGMGGLYAPVAAPFSPLLNPAIKESTEVAKKLGLQNEWAALAPKFLGVGMDVLGGMGILHGAGGLRAARTAGTEFSPGQGPWDNHSGSEIIKGIVDKDNPNAVTSSQVDQSIAQGFKNHPAAKDFEDVAAAMNAKKNAVPHTPDSAFNGDTAYAMENIFRGKNYDGKPVELSGVGMRPEEIAGLEKDGLATDGKMSSEQFGKYDSERSERLNRGKKPNLITTKNGESIVNTRSQGQQYHGSPSKIGNLAEYSYSAQNIYGQGFYTSDAGDVVHGYANRRGAAEPTMYRADEKQPVKLFNMADPIPDSIKDYIKNSNNDALNDALEDSTSLKQLYDYAREVSSNMGISASDMHEDFDGMADVLRKDGYGGLTHKGGSNTGTTPHTVKIYFDPAKDIALTEINKDTFKLPNKIDTLHEIYKQTGVHPDQVFEDARRDPAIAADIGAGRIPAAYSDLIEKPSPEQAKSQMAELEKQLDKTQAPEERQSIIDKMDKLVDTAIGPKPEESSLYGDIAAKFENMPQPLKDLRYGLLNKKMEAGIITPKEMAEREILSKDKSLHFDMPDDVAESMAKMDALSKESPPVELSKEGASKSINPLAKIFNPTGMSEGAKDMATALRQGRGPENRDIAVIQDALQKHAKTFAKMSDADRLKFIDYMENRSSGAKLANPELQEAADAIRDIYAQVAKKIQEQFPDVGLRKDYFTHQYEDEGAAAKFFSDWIAKQGSERNLQTRTFPTLSEAMEAGLKPKTTNPIETVMRYVTNMGNLMAAHRSIELARESGIAEYFNKGQQPEGWVPLNSNLAEKDGKMLFAPEDAARVYNNDVSKGFTGPIGDLLDYYQRYNNFSSKMVLGLSGYHFSFTTMSSMSSDVGRALNGGEVSDLGRAVTPGANTLRGQKYIDSYLGREDLSPELQKALDLAVKNNTINVKQQDYWKAGPAKDYIDIFKNGSASAELKAAGQTIKEHPIIGPVKIIADELGRTMDTIAKPLFDYYIPRIKIAANIDELHDWLQNNPDATPEMQDKAAQDIGNSIDNRFGEMMRDNLFWHKTTQQTLQTLLTSYSWVTGAARMLKGVPDTASWIANKQELSSSARYLMGMAATYTVANATATYLHTGQYITGWNWRDLLFYRTGGTTAQGQPERALLPSHIGQFTNYLHDGIGELGNEASPGLKLIYHLLANKDFRGLPITNENNKWYEEQKWDDYLKYTLGEETPIGLKSFIQGDKKGSKIGVVEKLLGARQAPQFITDPEGYDAMMKKVNDGEYRKKLRSDRKIQSQYEDSED